GAVGPGAGVLLRRRPRSLGLALVGGVGGGGAAHHVDLSVHENGSHSRPRRGAAPRHARLHERWFQPVERLSGFLGSVRRGRRRGGAMIARMTAFVLALVVLSASAPSPARAQHDTGAIEKRY